MTRALPVPLFAPVPGRSGKLRCLLCGTTGWQADPERPAPWQRKCLQGHPYRCDTCRRPFASRIALASHRRCKLHHDCCSHHTTVPAWKNPFSARDAP